MTNLNSILKSRDITLPSKVKAMVFPVVTYGCDSWTIKKAEHQIIDGFELWCWRRLLRIPWTARRSNLSILKEISPEYWLEGLMLKLKLQYFGHLMWRTDSLEKTLVLGKIESRRRRGCRKWDGWMPSLARWTWVWASSGSWWWTGKSGMLQSMGSQRVRHNWATELNTSIPNSLTIPYPHPPLRFVLSLRTHEDIKASCAGNLSSGKEEKRHNLGRKGRRWPRKSSQRNWLIT